METPSTQLPGQGGAAGPTAVALSMAAARASEVYGAALAAAAKRVSERQQDAYAAYVRQVQELQREVAERSTAAINAYWQHCAALSTSGEQVDACARAYRSYVENVQRLLGEPVQSADALKAYASLIGGLADIPPAGSTPQPRSSEILRDSAETLRRLWERTEQREAVAKAFADYATGLQALQQSVSDGARSAQDHLVESLRDAWTQADVAGRGDRIVQDYVGSAREALEELHAAVGTAAAEALAALRASPDGGH